MKNRILVVLTALLYLTVGHAGNISVDNISLKPGETKALMISLSSSVGSNVGVQFDLTIPEGFTLEKNGDAIYTVSTIQDSDLACNVKDLGNGVFRFVLYSNSLQSLKSGELMSVNLKANSSKELGSYNISLSGISFSDGDGFVTKESDVQATIKVTNYFTLLYKVDGETYKSYDVEYGATITPEEAPTKEGYTFSGWSEIPATMPAHDVTITGTFTINKYKLTYKVDGEIYKSYDVEFGATITPEPAPTKEGYNFSGWSEIPATMPAHDVTVTGTFTIVDPVTVTAKSYSRKYGEANPTFEYTTSGATLTGTPEITCEATITSPVGEYPIVISKGTVTNYNDHYINGVLTITKAPLTITAKSYSIKQGDALPTFEAEYSGFKNNETSSVLTTQPTIRTTATSASEPGTYEITISGAEATNYDITYVKGTLTITKADEVVVTAKSYSRKYGEANPTFEYTTSGATLTGTPSISCEATAKSPVGEYDIVVSKGSITNYNVTLVNGKLTVTKAPLTITAKSYSIKQGDALPSFEADYAGFKNNETDAVLAKKPTITTTATSASAPGTYDIVVADASAANYDITYVKGTLTITKADEVVVTAKSYSRKYGEANPTFEYITSGATLTGTPSISCEATATSPVGEYDIVVSKGSITNYNVTLVNGKLTVTKAPLTITAKSYTIKQGDTLPTFEAEYAGFKNNETSAVLAKKPTITTTATSASEPGTYEIVVSGAEAQNYDITYVKGTLTITKADEVVVTAKSYSRKYGEANPTFEYTTSGATLTGTPSISCEATATSPVGEYDIVVSKGSITNYNVTLVNGKLTVTKAPLTITAKSYSIKQGDALPSFEADYAGFKNNETDAVLAKKPTITTTATSASAPGTYDIVVADASAANYDITYVKGTLTITKADEVVVTAKSYSRKYGEANPAFEYTTSGATLTGTPSISCEATAKSPVGEYDIVVSKGSITNYNVTLVNGKLTITKAPLTITAKSYTIKQGDALPTFEAAYEGFKNNETNSVLTTQPRITTTATSASAPGTYEITISGASANNYDITYVKGTLTISAVEVEPVTETETTTFSEEVNENTDLSNTIIDNTYYTMNAENGDGYDATEQAIVLNTTTTAEQMNAIQNAQVGDATMQANYNGIIFEVPAGSGTITVEVKTIGSHVLNVQIGNGAPNKITKSERGTADVPYNVTKPTYVYLYASTSGASGAPQRAAAANSVLLYSYKVDVLVNGISVVTYGDMENAKWYTTDGVQLQGKPTKKGLYIVNGRKVVVK